jgi:hypothetical protein
MNVAIKENKEIRRTAAAQRDAPAGDRATNDL